MTTFLKKLPGLAAGLGVLTAFASMASAQEPENWKLGFQPAATEIAREIHIFHSVVLLPIITAIVLLVLGLLLWVMIRYNEKANPEPKKFSHNTLIEVVWTAVPVVILLIIAIPSFRLLNLEDNLPEADMTIKAIGYQWYWDHEYPDHGDFAVTSIMLPDEEATAAGLPKKLAVDNNILVPVDTTVRVITTAADVIHAWTIPSFGVKIDAIPGRLNETWFRAEKEGVYYGQCSELCGLRHAFMPSLLKW